LVDKLLQQDEGITYSLFNDDGDDRAADEADEPEDPENSEKNQAAKSEPKLPKHILVPEVVRKPKMHFYTVPRLGAYLAVKLEYDSCLHEEAFDAAVADFAEVAQKQADLEREKHEWEEQQAELKAEKLDAGEIFVREEKEWPVTVHAPFSTKKV